MTFRTVLPLATAALAVALLSLSCNPASAGSLLHARSDARLLKLASLEGPEIGSYLGETDDEDIVGSWYRDGRTRERVVAFFTELTGDEGTAVAILDSAVAAGVAPELAFALAWEESRYRPGARNENIGSVDRGLFQLNSKSFPTLAPADAYDPVVNARLGVQHLAFCLRAGGNEVSGLAMYNAGKTRVSRDGTPKKTLDYVFRIIRYEQNIAELFLARIAWPSRNGTARAG